MITFRGTIEATIAAIEEELTVLRAAKLARSDARLRSLLVEMLGIDESLPMPSEGCAAHRVILDFRRNGNTESTPRQISERTGCSTDAIKQAMNGAYGRWFRRRRSEVALAWVYRLSESGMSADIPDIAPDVPYVAQPN